MSRQQSNQDLQEPKKPTVAPRAGEISGRRNVCVDAEEICRVIDGFDLTKTGVVLSERSPNRLRMITCSQVSRVTGSPDPQNRSLESCEPSLPVVRICLPPWHVYEPTMCRGRSMRGQGGPDRESSCDPYGDHVLRANAQAQPMASSAAGCHRLERLGGLA